MSRLRKFVLDYRHVSPAARYICQLTCMLVLSLFCGALAAFFLADRVGEYNSMIQLSQELIALARPCVGVMGLGALVVQAISSAETAE